MPIVEQRVGDSVPDGVVISFVHSFARSFVHDVAPLVAVEDRGLVVLAPLLVEDIVFIIVIAWMSQQI